MIFIEILDFLTKNDLIFDFFMYIFFKGNISSVVIISFCSILIWFKLLLFVWEMF